MSEQGYSIGQMAKMSGVSLRTLRFYDESGLLVPQRAANGYRVYDDAAVDRLQQILLYRELELPIEEIRRALNEGADSASTLTRQRTALQRKRDRIDTILSLIDKTLDAQNGGGRMTAQQKLDPFVKKELEENDAAYGTEMRERFGDEAYEKRYDAVKELDKEGFDDLNAGLEAIHQRMAECLKAGETPDGAAAQALVQEHHAYLGKFGDFYTDEVYAQLGQGYAADPRFRAHYEALAPGLADWLAQAIAVHTA